MFARIVSPRELAAGVALLLAATVLQAQSFTRIQNRFRPQTFMHAEGGSVECGTIQPGWWSADWVLEPVAEDPQFFRIRNRFRGTYIHIEHGAVTSSPLGLPGWQSAQWTRESVPGTDFVRLRNRWRPTIYLNTEQGRLAASPIEPGWWSAQWALVTSPTSAPAGGGGQTGGTTTTPELERLQRLLWVLDSDRFLTESNRNIVVPGMPGWHNLVARLRVLEDSIALVRRLLPPQPQTVVTDAQRLQRVRDLRAMRVRIYGLYQAAPVGSADRSRIANDLTLIDTEIFRLTR